jgi:hypothetical protein
MVHGLIKIVGRTAIKIAPLEIGIRFGKRRWAEITPTDRHELLLCEPSPSRLEMYPTSAKRFNAAECDDNLG